MNNLFGVRFEIEEVEENEEVNEEDEDFNEEEKEEEEEEEEEKTAILLRCVGCGIENVARVQV